jgi:hypothetical protein
MPSPSREKVAEGRMRGNHDDLRRAETPTAGGLEPPHPPLRGTFSLREEAEHAQHQSGRVGLVKSGSLGIGDRRRPAIRALSAHWPSPSSFLRLGSMASAHIS